MTAAGHHSGNRSGIIGHEQVVSKLGEPCSDRELWDRATERDGTSFGLLFVRHGRTVYNHCFRRTASWAEAEDLPSPVFLEAWRRRRDVRFYTDSIVPWLLAVANNVVRNARRPKAPARQRHAPWRRGAQIETREWRRRCPIQTSLTCGNGSTCSAHTDRSRRSDPDHLDAGDGVVVVVLGDDRDPLNYRGCCHEHVEDRDPAAVGAQGSSDAGKLARHLSVHG